MGVYKSTKGEHAVRERYLRFLKCWPVPNRHLHVPTREGETFVVACGPEAAPALVLLHGSGGNATAWMPDVALWAAHFRVFAIDVIGDTGNSAPSRPPLASDAHALWLDDVMRFLSLRSASFLGISNGGWLAIDYATRRPERVDSLVLLCPAGVGRARNMVVPISLLARVRRRCARTVRAIALGRLPSDPPRLFHYQEFIWLISRHWRPRTEKHPIFSDESLQRLKMPVLAILGGQDLILDSTETRSRLEGAVPHCEIRFYPELGHAISGQAAAILEFLLRSQA